MATYSNQHWLLSHIRNSFISTDDTGMCETVMQSDDLPKHYLRKFQGGTSRLITNNNNVAQQQSQQGGNVQRKSVFSQNGNPIGKAQLSFDRPLQEVDFVCYPGLDLSDDEDLDLSTQSVDILMYPEVGAYRARSNTAQKLEKMDIARRKAARTKNVNFDDEVIPPERSDFFVKKAVVKLSPVKKKEVNQTETQGEAMDRYAEGAENDNKLNTGFKSKLTIQLANSPKQPQNKFMDYARFDGTSHSGSQTKRINVFLSMLPGREKNYPIKICVLSTAKIIEVIGFVCYKATIQYPDISLKSVRNYALYMSEDNDDMEEFPPLDNHEPCSKFGFSHLTLAERRPVVPITRVDFLNNAITRATTSQGDKSHNLNVLTMSSIHGIDLKGGNSVITSDDPTGGADAFGTHSSNGNEDEAQQTVDYDALLNHDDMLEAPMYRTYRLQIIDKRFFKTDVTLGISGERIEIDQHKNAKFWSKQKAVTFPIEDVAACEIVERRHAKATLRIYLKSSSSPSILSSTNIYNAMDMKPSCLTANAASNAMGSSSSSNPGNISPHSPTSPSHYTGTGGAMSGTTFSSSPFGFFSSSSSSGQQQHHHHTHHMRFKHYDFEADLHTADHIHNKLKCILEVRSSEARREFLQLRARKLEKSNAKKNLKT